MFQSVFPCTCCSKKFPQDMGHLMDVNDATRTIPTQEAERPLATSPDRMASVTRCLKNLLNLQTFKSFFSFHMGMYFSLLMRHLITTSCQLSLNFNFGRKISTSNAKFWLQIQVFQILLQRHQLFWLALLVALWWISLSLHMEARVPLQLGLMTIREYGHKTPEFCAHRRRRWLEHLSYPVRHLRCRILVMTSWQVMIMARQWQ